ncbi:glutamyl-tRNA reductase [Clostridium arbusti]|uniref:glutamyl-tRNA reductase n=1 Tax=Clostridium arbusti TaxID=1137848 RepID=UPI0002886396|nr:glutamyl-tRNA reductase [Clostridium arbusti]
MYYLVMAGIDYKYSNLETREKVNFTSSAIKRAFEKIKDEGVLKEAVILSTCNRSEVYGILEEENGEGYLRNFYSSFFNIDIEEINDNVACRSGFDVIDHLFQVTNGFKSMVLGEDQILGQVKTAYNEALKNKGSGKILNRLFLNSITNAKKVKTITNISHASTSVSAIGIKLINRHLGSLRGKKVLVVGLGKMSKIAIKYLLSEGVEKIYITNRTKNKVTDLEVISDNIEGIDFDNKYDVIKDVDVIISCTSAPHFVVHKEEFLKNYSEKSICILDLSVPRDVDPKIGYIDGVSLYVIDDIEKIAKENENKRIKEFDRGMVLVREDVYKYLDWIKDESIDVYGCNVNDTSKLQVEKNIAL